MSTSAMQPPENSRLEQVAPASRSASVGSTPSDPPQKAGPLPSLNLPKGGGAIRGMGEKFAANPVTGTGSLSVPIFTSPGRSGFGPQLSLTYDSGSGNSPFGFGWSLALPAITRKTDNGLPQYQNAQESDVFLLSGAEDLMPSLVEAGGQWMREITPSRSVYGNQYAIHRYRPRVEGLFARIERWTNLSDATDTFWRSISKDNITTWFGKTAESRVTDPADPTRIFSWLICQSYDDKGNVIAYQYKSEDSSAIDLTQVNERNRTTITRSANRYLKHIFYGNRVPYFPVLTDPTEAALPTDWCFELVFDYGEHDAANPVPQEASLWSSRLDPFSTYRPTFEVRTYRLCRRALMFHHFANETNIGLNCLVCSTDLTHSAPPSTDPTIPFYSYLRSARKTSYVRNGTAAYFSKSLPPLEFEYTEASVDETVRDIDPDSLRNHPYGLDGAHYRWVDLDGEGSSGILTEQAGSWFYKSNLSPATSSPRFAPVQLVAKQPSLAALNSGRQQLLNLSGDGQLDLVDFEGPTPGYFERTDDANWKPFVNFQSLPILNWRNPELKFVDLTGDGFADLLISEGDAFWWYQSLATLGFASGQRLPQAFDEEQGPKIIFSDSQESIFLADLSGDGLTDLVRIRNGEACYWPNLGYGHFGAKVTMDNAPLFDRPDLFDGRRIHLADIDGSGTVDIIYFASNYIQLYFNQSGNGWGGARVLRHFPPVDSASSATVLDLLGNGTACLVWSSPLAGNARQPMHYIDLLGGQKPHLLVRVTNNLGAETVIQYAASTKFYVEDKLAGTPWVTRLPFPLHVVERVQRYDYVSRNLFITRYSYHHGYYDGVEREFRGFGRVDQWDIEDFATLTASVNFPEPANLDAASNVPPVLTKTWFHTGAYFEQGKISRHFENEYYSEPGLSPAQLDLMLLNDTVLPVDILLPDGSPLAYSLSPEELREACRALRGSILRQEIYALDGADSVARPYTASDRNYTIEALQPQGPNQYAVFFAHPRETIDFHYERKLFLVTGNTLDSASVTKAADPRVMHSFTLAVDSYGNVLQSAAVGYGRRYFDPAITPADQLKQRTTLITCGVMAYTNAILLDDSCRTPLPAQSTSYELLQAQPASTQPGVTNLFSFDEMANAVVAASDGQHDIAYENLQPTGLIAGQPYRRLLKISRTLYRPNDMGASVNNVKALLPSNTLESRALPGESYTLAFTSGLIPLVYQRGTVALLPDPATVLGSTGPDGGAYVDLDADGNWWIPSGRIYYASALTTSQDESGQAAANFFLPRLAQDPFGNSTSVDYDSYNALAVTARDALLNTVTTVNDYRVLQPSLLTDPNGNRAAVSFDILGMVVGTAVMGKTTEALGDSFTTFTPDLTQQQIDDFYTASDPHTLAGDLLGTATTRIVYDVDRFQNSQSAAPADPTQWQPAFAATLARETHVSELTSGQQTKIQIGFSYSDGFGREIQKKIQTEPGPGVDAGPFVNPRWAGSGWTIFNNKGKPIRQYEPFFSQLVLGHQFEFGVQVGVSPVLFYDPVERVVATLHPDHTYDKVVFDPWQQTTWDVNDTVLQTNPASDADVCDFFQPLPTSDYLPSWYSLRTDPAYATQAAQLWPDPVILAKQAEAANKTAAHANTPAIAYFDTLGRPFLIIADNAADGKYQTRVELDIEGRQRSVIDALGRTVMVYDYDLPGNSIHHASMEAGERWSLNDIAGKSIRGWDTRGHNFRTAYDAMRRPTSAFVQGTDSVNSDPRTLAVEVLTEQTIYGEGQPNDTTNNLRTRVFQHNDGSGATTSLGINPVTNQNEAYDFKGNPLHATRQLLQDYKGLANWSGAPPVLQSQVFITSTQYDALNRRISAVAPDGSVFRDTFNEANLLETIIVNLQGSQTTTPFVTNIDYDAKGQRTLIQYGNRASTSYSYDPATFRLIRLTTTRTRADFTADQQIVQDLQYTFDPAGNITHIQDNAQDIIFFNNLAVCPSNDYTYDAVYRLTLASGREHLGQSGAGGAPASTPASYNDVPRVQLPQPGDSQAMGLYTEQYQYDSVGNFLQYKHYSSDPANPAWARSYTYSEFSLLESVKVSNRLTSTAISGSQAYIENYNYDLHGNMTRMPQLQSMQWNYQDQLLITQRQAVNSTDADGLLHQAERTYYVYDSSGQRARKLTERQNGTLAKERIYLGGYEIYREYDPSGAAIALERESLHILDGTQRICLAETRTQGTDATAPKLIRYQFSNHLGSTSLELDDLAQIISYEEYFPYGSTSYQAGRSTLEASLKRYRYTGMERDEESGLNYHTARYYMPWLGRWASVDPEVSRLSNVSPFIYSSANPIVLFDDSGRAPKGLDELVKKLGRFEKAVGRLVGHNSDAIADYKDGRASRRALEGNLERAREYAQDVGEILNDAQAVENALPYKERAAATSLRERAQNLSQSLQGVQTNIRNALNPVTSLPTLTTPVYTDFSRTHQAAIVRNAETTNLPTATARYVEPNEPPKLLESGGGGAITAGGLARKALGAVAVAAVVFGDGSAKDKVETLAAGYGIGKGTEILATQVAGAELAEILSLPLAFFIGLCGDQAGACEAQERAAGRKHLEDEIDERANHIYLTALGEGYVPEWRFVYERAVHEEYVALGLDKADEARLKAFGPRDPNLCYSSPPIGINFNFTPNTGPSISPR
jgi:RHS repeat-associated protein